MLTWTPATDTTEFPGGFPGVSLEHLPQVAVHEMSHVFQMQTQGPANYLAIYQEPGRRTHAALAIREGCADYRTWRASGLAMSERQRFVREHAPELWAEFRPLLHEIVEPGDPWFGGRSAARPDWPLQVGYGLGEEICRTFVETADDESAALRAVWGAHLPDHFDAIIAPYAQRM